MGVRTGTLLAVLGAALALTAPAGAATYAKGVDVSNWNGSIDWIQVADGGYTFLFAKASEGTTFTDVTYALNRAGAQAFGLRLGAYHFGRPSGTGDATIAASAIAQADHFVDVAQPKAGDLPPVLDLETTGGLNQARLVQWTQAWLAEVAARTGVSGLIYASPSFWKTRLGDTTVFAGDGTKLWIAHWTTSPAPLVPAANWDGLGWAFWQWTDCAQVPGFAHCGDGDRANGPSPNPFALRSFPTGPPGPATPPSVAGTAKAGAKLAGVPGTWSGGKPVAFTYQWQSCDAAGGGCTPILGATLETYTPGAADIGHALVLTVTASTPAGSASASSAPTTPVAASNGATVPVALTPPQLSGTTQVGQTLTASAGTWSGAPTVFAFEWRRCDATGAACTPITGATFGTYTLTPGDQGATISLVVTAANPVGAQSASATTTAPVAPAPVPAAVPGSLAAVAAAAGAVVTTDGGATVTWQPGAVPVGTTVSLATAGQALQLGLAPAVATLPWPVDVAYAAAPAGQVVGFSTDGRIWRAVAAVASPALPAGLLEGAYVDAGGLQHVLTRKAGSFRLFVPNAWGDPSKVSRLAPRLRRVAPIRVKRLRGGALVVSTRMATPSQVLVLPSHRRILAPGSFPVRLRVSARTRHVHLVAIDPWGRRGGFTLSFRSP